MTKVLAIDTSTSRTSVAIIDGDTVLFGGFLDGATAHGPSLPALVQEALEISEVDEVVVGMGPGPFTGLRVGIVTAAVFAHAREISIHGICSLDAVAFDFAKPCVVVTDARRKELYWARYDGIRVGEPQVSKPEALAAQFPESEFVGPGAKLYPDYVSGDVMELKAGSLARLFASGSAQLVDVSPMYLRKPDAVEPTIRKSVL